MKNRFFRLAMTLLIGLCALTAFAADEAESITIPMEPAPSPSNDKPKQFIFFTDTCATFSHLIKACDSKPLCFYYLGPRKVLADLNGDGVQSPGEPLLPECDGFSICLALGGKTGMFHFTPEGDMGTKGVCVSPCSALKGTFKGKDIYLIDKNMNFQFDERETDGFVYGTQPEVKYGATAICAGDHYKTKFDAQTWTLTLTPIVIDNAIKISVVPRTANAGQDSYAVLILKNEKTREMISLSSGTEPVSVPPGVYGVSNGMIFNGLDQNAPGHVGANATPNSTRKFELKADTVITVGLPARLTVTLSGKNGHYTLEKPYIVDAVGAIYGCKTANGTIEATFAEAPEILLYKGKKKVKSFGRFKPG